MSARDRVIILYIFITPSNIMTLFALFVWKNDDPITGNVLSVTNIVDPRKPICDYKVGDVVSVRLKSFGNSEGIIGLIGDESKQKEMQSILDKENREKFCTLVQTLMPDETLKKKSAHAEDIQQQNVQGLDMTQENC